jgi:hypothetical protein
VSAPAQNNLGSKMTRVAVMTLVVAIAIYLAARLIESVAPVLIVCGVMVAVTYTVIVIIRRKRDRW